MKNKNLHILIMMVSAVAFQACGEQAVSEGFTETDISSSPSLSQGIQEGVCEETEIEFTFKSSVSAPGTMQRFKKGNGIVLGPDGEEYVMEDSKSSAQADHNEPYECKIEVTENREEIIFTAKAGKIPPRKYIRSARGTALVN